MFPPSRLSWHIKETMSSALGKKAASRRELSPPFFDKSEILSTKSETNPNVKIQMLKTKQKLLKRIFFGH